MSIHGKDLLTTQTWDISELKKIIYLAKKMKLDPFNIKWKNILKNKKFLMLFYNPSLRTQLSFESAVTDLGGYPIYRTPTMDWSQQEKKCASAESIKDIAKVMSRYVDGIGIRIVMDAISFYDEAQAILQSYAQYADVPVISMADNYHHPCQGLADIMAWAERVSLKSAFNLAALNGKTLLLTWGSSGFARPWASVQSHLLLAAQVGMNIKLAYPAGYDLDPNIVSEAKQSCCNYGRSFQIMHDPDLGYSKEVDVVYVRNWVTSGAYAGGKFNYAAETSAARQLSEWIVTAQRMEKTNNALFANPMPLDRGKEAENSVADSPYSVIYEVAENRKHIQKALLALTMGRKNQASKLYKDF